MPPEAVGRAEIVLLPNRYQTQFINIPSGIDVVTFDMLNAFVASITASRRSRLPIYLGREE